MNHFEVPVPYHQQDAARACSAAVAQMVLEAIGGSVPTQMTLLGAIDAACKSAEGVGCAMGLASTINANQKKRTFAENRDPSFATGCRRIAHSLTAAASAVPAIVQNGNHWVLVYGVDVSSNAAPGPHVAAFWFNDPEPKTASLVMRPLPRPNRPPPEHSKNDMCGHGLPLHHNGTWNFGMPATMATVAGTPNGWQTFWWLTGAPEPPPFVTVTADAEFDVAARGSATAGMPPAVDPAPAGARMAPHPAPPGPGPAPGPGSDGAMIRPDDARREASRGIAAIPPNAPVSRALRGAEPDEVVRVWRLDVSGDAYDLVTMTKARTEPVALATVDAHTGTFLGVQVFPQHSISSVIPLEAAKEIFAEFVRRGAYGGGSDEPHATERYVWRPGSVSRSPYAPVVEFIDRGKAYYVAGDGNVYEDLY
jgi:hypothetical protein